MAKHKELEKWVKDMADMCQPDEVIWINGSEEEKRSLQQEAFSTGELIEMNQEKWPGCVYHRTATNDVARVEHLTFICTEKEEDAGPNNNWMAPKEAYAKAAEIFKGSMKGRKMYVIPFCMGPLDSPHSKIGVELTDSIYVVLNMRIMTIVGDAVLEKLGTDGEFTRGLHGKEERDPERRYIMHFPQDNTIWSVGSGYGGNVLLGKKCLALRIASYLALEEGWMAEHMLILGIEKDGVTRYVAAAFPSACGKTNLAMLVPPDEMKEKGYKIWTVGDDIAWMRINEKGELLAVNPESGYFGVAPGTNMKTNPNAMLTVQKNTIFTNVVLGEDGDIWWEGMEKDPPQPAWDWKGNPWYPGKKDENGKEIPGAHPNSRFTAPYEQCPTAVTGLPPEGVKIDALIFGGRRARLAPLAYEAFDWPHGVYVGATMASERTAAQYGKQGEVRRDPMAMLPFCGYNMADYFGHWLNMGEKMGKNSPKVFHVNWFRQDDEGNFIWPGFGENLRVLEWIVARCHGEAGANETPIGYIPKQEDLDLKGLDVTDEDMNRLLSIDPKDWIAEAEDVEQFFSQFGDRMPKALLEQHKKQQERLQKAV